MFYMISKYNFDIFVSKKLMQLRSVISRLFAFGNTRQKLKDTTRELNKFRLVLDQAPAAVYIINKDMYFEYINPSFTRQSGYTKEDLLNKHVNETIYKGRIPESRLHVAEALRKGDTWQGELLTTHKTGSTYWASTIASPYKNEKNEVEGFIIIQQDITEHKRIQIALDESEKLYRTLIEKSLDGAVLSQNGKIVMVNKAFCDMVGCTIEETLTFGPNELIAPEDRERVMEIHFQRMRGEIDNMSYSATLLHKTGKHVVAEFNSTTVQVNSSIASFITIRDITEREQLIKALRESELKYKALVENSQDGISIILNNKILFANNTFCRMLGYSLNELQNMPAVNTLHPDEHQRAIQISERRRNHDFSTITESYKLLTKSGEIKECETTSTFIEYGGQMASFYTSHDITESKRMQIELKESEEKYRTLIDKATDGILITQSGVFKFVNPAFCEMMQYTENELINKPFIDVVDKEHHAEMLENHKRRMNGESFPAIYRAKLYRKDGSSIIVELNSRTTDFEGKTASFVITRDITDRLQKEEELRKAQKELENLNQNLETRVQESTLKLTEANTQLIRLQKENLQSQFEVLRQQVNPHFLFNSLNVLTSLIKLEPDLAEKFTEHLSKVYRYVLENKDNDLVDLITELDFLDAYMFLLNIRFMDKIKMDVSITLNTHQYSILPLALQLIIENAIKHNTMSKKMPLHIKIFADEEQMLNVTNNLQERESHMASTGVGLKNITHRYKLLEMREPEFFKNETHFVARIPLKKKE
jgi:PAS domain S-box-containing protein